MKKVIVRLGNGLGNQLFIYAAAYSFAKRNNAELYVDDESGFYKRHKYELKYRKKGVASFLIISERENNSKVPDIIVQKNNKKATKKIM